MSRRPAFYRRTLLNNVDGFPEFDDNCYLEWRPLTYRDNVKLASMSVDGITDEEAAARIAEVVKGQFVSGKIYFRNEDGSLELGDLEAQYVEQLPGDLIERLFAEMTGVQYSDDPKGEASSQGATTTKSSETPS